jgi:hypothetical protein
MRWIVIGTVLFILGTIGAVAAHWLATLFR